MNTVPQFKAGGVITPELRTFTGRYGVTQRPIYAFKGLIHKHPIHGYYVKGLDLGIPGDHYHLTKKALIEWVNDLHSQGILKG